MNRTLSGLTAQSLLYVKPIVFYKSCGYVMVRHFAPTVHLQTVMDALRSEFPEITEWRVRGRDNDDLKTLDCDWHQPWEAALRRCGALPLYAPPEVVVYGLTDNHRHSH